jgi:PBP superfamily domain
MVWGGCRITAHHLVLRTLVADDEQWLQLEVHNNRICVDLMLPGVARLSLTADLVAQIFQGTITSFNNVVPWYRMRLYSRAPNVNITVVTRLESSGTTALFTEYLDKASDLWTLGTGFTVAFPDIVRSVTGTGSVVSAVSAVGNSIGWVPRHPVRCQPEDSYLAPAYSCARCLTCLPRRSAYRRRLFSHASFGAIAAALPQALALLLV